MVVVVAAAAARAQAAAWLNVPLEGIRLAREPTSLDFLGFEDRSNTVASAGLKCAQRTRRRTRDARG